jgi:hypothetical protein
MRKDDGKQPGRSLTEEKTRILIIGKNDKEVKFLDTKKNNF